MSMPTVGLSVLYADDEEQVREMMAKMLRWKGLVVHTAADGGEAWNLFRIHKPDIIVTDIRMPVMDGIEMSRKVREFCPSTTIIVASAFLHEQHMADFDSIGIHSYIQKPIELEKLLSSIETGWEKMVNAKH
ncbi:MAG: response regulator [Geobacteraceae bacterium]|nr:response regulator [Geobacteraceae bacterium]